MSGWLYERTLRRDLVWIAALGLAVQAFWAWRLVHPSYFDAYYYTTNAQRLADGYGFTQEIIWQYLDDPQGLPTPSFTYWMPLPALLGAAGYALTGTFRGAQLPFWLLAGLLPWLGYAISWRLTRQRWQARTAALFTMAGGYYAAYWNQPTTFVLFAWLGGGCLLALGMALERKTAVSWLAAGLLAGLAHLARADGVLLLGLGGLLGLLELGAPRLADRRLAADASADAPANAAARRWRAAANLMIFAAGYLLVMGGWFWRTYRLIGTPLSPIGTQTIFLTAYNDVFAYGRSFTLQSFLAWGWRNILMSRLQASWLALQTFIAVTGLTVFTFFFVWAWIQLGRQEETRRFLRPFTWYTLLLYGVMALVFTFPGQRGSLLHSSTALWPWSMALAVAGLDIGVDWVAARRPSWQPRQAKRLFAAVFVGMVFVITLAVAGGQPLAREEAVVYRQVAAALPADAVVMTGTAPDFYYHTGLRAIALPNEPPDVLVAMARRYGVGYLLLDAERPPVLTDLYAGRLADPRIVPQASFDGGFELYRFEVTP